MGVRLRQPFIRCSNRSPSYISSKIYCSRIFCGVTRVTQPTLQSDPHSKLSCSSILLDWSVALLLNQSFFHHHMKISSCPITFTRNLESRPFIPLGSAPIPLFASCYLKSVGDLSCSDFAAYRAAACRGKPGKNSLLRR